MVYATSDGSAGKRLRVGMVGGGRNAFIGAVHRLAMRLDDQIVLIAGALSSDPENAAASAAEIGIAPERSYADFREMARVEATLPDGIEAVVIVTPNHLHAPIATAFLEAGIDVICDKPLSTTLADAEALVALAQAKKCRFVVTLNNTGYAMVRQAREMVRRASSGDRVGAWRLYPGLADCRWTPRARAGGVAHRSAGQGSRRCADIGVHAFNLASYISG